MPSPVQVPTGRSTVLVGSAITLLVVSGDQELVALCRDVLREFAETLGDPHLHSKGEKVGQIKVCLWDYRKDEVSPVEDEFADSQVFYLVEPSHLERLLRDAPAAEGHILLKPVTRAVLRTFLWSAATVRKTPAAVVGTLRANRDDLLQRLLQANLRLQEYDQQRTNFIARAVHDFRAPLTALSGFCGLLASGQLGPLNDQQVEALRRMEHSAKRISRMASAMFELSIGDKVNRKPDLREGDIMERIKQALHEIHPLAQEKQIRVEAKDITAPDQPLYFESSQIEQVLLNLLDNACKFTIREGAIKVRAYPYFWERRFLVQGSAQKEKRVDSIRRPNSYRIDIKDTGPGIPRDRLNHIFEEYTSYSGPQDRSGGGLGLAICRMILSRHQGRIWADSHEDGATFSFVIPYRRAELQSSKSVYA
jgi:signal transduction histidine kinase